MEELFDHLQQHCIFSDETSLTHACQTLGLNIEKLLEYSLSDSEARDKLKICCIVIIGRLKTKYFDGLIAKCEADALIAETQEIEEVYLNAFTDTSEGD